MPPVSAPEQQTEGSRASGREGSRGQVSHALRKVMEQRRSDRAIAEGAGFLGALSQEGVFGDMFSNTGLGDGLVDAIGDMEGPSGKGQLGTGLGWNSNGPGAGGKVATDSRGSGTTGRGGDGRSLDGGGPAGTKKQGAVTVSGEVIRVGGMDAALIDGVVKQHLNSFRYCYQRQLQRDPTLRGKVTLKWVIAGDGSVSSAAVKTDTTGNGVVGTCMAGVARRMRFPEPKGGLVIVIYPFLFSPQ